MKSQELRRPASKPAPASCCGGDHGHDHNHAPAAAVSQDKPFTDPVCGMKAAANPEKSATYEGETYYFCSNGCVTKFKADPMRYLAPVEKELTAAEKEAIYTCPMHPEIQQVGPGSCPICGMALEPMHATAVEDTTELDDMTRRFWFSLVLSLPLLFTAMGDVIGIHVGEWIGHSASGWLQALLATPVVLWCGYPFLERALQSFKTRNLNMFSLIGIGVMAAWLFSMIGLLFPDALPEAFKMGGMAPL